MLGLLALAAGFYLAAHHPLWPVLACPLFAAWVALAAWRPALWLFVLPAALPWLNFAPWTGWVVVDEFDLLVLGAMAGGYLRWGRDALPAAALLPKRPSTLALLLGALAGLGLWRGFADAGFVFGGYQGYAEALNSLRVFKPLAFALLLWPLLQRQLSSAVRLVAAGVPTGLAVAALAVLWERAAFPGLWDFSEPYRATALFWEMHVGGAAIDAYLAMTLPFVAWALWSARSPWQWLAAAVLALVAVYACLTTFSRGVYLAVAGPMLLLGLGLLARGLGFDHRAWLRRAWAGLGLGALAVALLLLALAAFGAAGIVGVTLVLLATLLALWQRLAGWRTAAGLGLALLLMLEVVAVFGTGNFMASRVRAGERDFGSRLVHWRNGVGLLHGPADWALGIGLGRLPAHYARFVPEREFSGAVQRVDAPSGHRAVRLAGPKTQVELGGLFALTQRVPLQPEAAYTLKFDVRVLAPADLLASVCEMHLLYEGHCQSARLHLRPATTSWQQHELTLQGPPLGAGAMPRLRIFALTLLGAGDELEFDNLRLIATGAQDLLRNGDFSDGLAHWLPAAQSYFVPWHIDNLYLELLIERGLAGLLLFMVLAGMALWNLLAGPGRQQPVAPFLATSLCAGLTIGLVSSLMDVPRVAFLFWFLMVLALSLDGDGEATSSADGRPS